MTIFINKHFVWETKMNGTEKKTEKRNEWQKNSRWQNRWIQKNSEHGKSVFVANPKIEQKQQQKGSLLGESVTHQWAVMRTAKSDWFEGLSVPSQFAV